MICALIGTSKFAEVHLSQLIKIGAKELALISRDIDKSEKICVKFKKEFPHIVIYPSKITILKKKKFDLIDICSAIKIHEKQLSYISGLDSIILVEKPIISLLKLKKKYLKFLKNLYVKNARIVVCYPMIYLSKEFEKIFDKKNKINNFELNFSTGGQYKYKYICMDLMPHALSFIFAYFKKFNFKQKFKIKKIRYSKNIWSTYFIYNKINFYFNFSENLKKKTSFEIVIDNKKIKRFSDFQQNEFVNLLKYNQKIIKIKNPLNQFFLELKRNKNNSNYFRNNKYLTMLLMKINYRFLFEK
jgi:hypothetical protein